MVENCRTRSRDGLEKPMVQIPEESRHMLILTGFCYPMVGIVPHIQGPMFGTRLHSTQDRWGHLNTGVYCRLNHLNPEFYASQT